MKTKRHFLVYMAYAVIYTTLTPPTWASSSEVIKRGFGATLVCPFNVINGPKSIGNVIVACYSNTSCPTPSLLGNAAWGGRGETPTLQNGSHTLSNDAMTNVGLTAFTTTASIQLEVHNATNTAFSLLCMSATVVAGVLTCTGGPYTLDINNL